ncbi:UDP-N-acetylmuramate dehydrogenase [Parapedobacter sp. ISTM3]|uniref:UDP-N-acetylmuramate dehydrogenase n=1 Tax=Parapedobacter sp. ISTM3 TaxID=2800130 RepID=UPI001907CFED|nr:UDP-N-acetylmuramate dehydrogenase [Parapedobacter sp. ISTM3]MBK1441650.1 UDP-N-acetylmuramate dehydrogenase [Parapedobacter sp. ISTM3]
MKVVEHLDLTLYNSYRIKAICKRAYFPDSENDIQTIYTSDDDVRKIVLGSGHNIILSKSTYDDYFIIFSGNFNRVTITGTEVVAEAGISMYDLSLHALAHELSGLELFYDIPSSLGGAVVMNAGASGEEIKDLLTKVRYYNPSSNQFADIQQDEMAFEYRNSFFQRNPHLIITKAWLSLKKGNKVAINEKMEQNKAVRWAKQPKEYPNAGSVFKRPKGFYVGALMDELQLKGYSIGGAKISEKHGGFIVNVNNATGDDILRIIKHAQDKVHERYGITLEVEQRII